LQRGLVVVRGGGELATASARLLFLSRFPVVVLEIERPLAVRRLVSFAEAVLAGEVAVEGVTARRVTIDEAAVTGFVPVIVDPEASSLEHFAPATVVDGRMLKRGGSVRSGDALLIGLGPGFKAGSDVDAVVETQRGPDLGRVIWAGPALADTAEPAPVLGVSEERVLRAPTSGALRGRRRIGELVSAGDVVAEVEGRPVVTPIAGLLRGLIADGAWVATGVKIGDVDPRGRAVDPARVSEKGRAVAAGVLEAVLVGARRS
jgi:xanthine dehydrogenase accessory factor